MKTMLALPVALLLALSVPALAQKGGGGGGGGGGGKDGGGGGGGGGGGRVKGAPGPLVGAGLPVLLIGGGIYWLVRRKKQASTN
jgi:LPXTG-motif cell wall-anchored protein